MRRNQYEVTTRADLASSYDLRLRRQAAAKRRQANELLRQAQALETEAHNLIDRHCLSNPVTTQEGVACEA